MSAQRKKIPHKLEDVVRRELGTELSKEHQGSDWGGELSPEMLAYAVEDSRILVPLAGALETKIRDSGLEKVADIERRALPAIAWMANAGVPFDAEGYGSYLEQKETELEHLKSKLDDLAPDHPEAGQWNWNSWQQIIEAFRLLGMNLPNTKEETLSRCDHPLAEALLEYRGVSKLVGTYGPKLLDKVEDGRIYGSWWQIGAGTGRMASSSPNLQNLPPQVRRYVRAPEGRVLVTADYSQVELRIAAKIAEDEKMLSAYAEGEDLHTLTARGLTGQQDVDPGDRKLAKAVNFGLLYGMGANTLADYARNSYGVVMDPQEAATYRSRFFETYPGIRRWHERERRNWQRSETESRTLTGRRRLGVERFTDRLNTPVQGTGADGLKLALALLWERRHQCPGAVPILAVHDEIVAECDETEAAKVEAWLERAMVDGMDEVLNAPGAEGPHMPVEVETEVGTAWLDG